MTKRIIALLILILALAVSIYILLNGGLGGKNSGSEENSGAQESGEGNGDSPSDSSGNPSGDSENGSQDAELDLDARVEKKLSEMTLEEKVCQLFVATPESLTGFNPVTQAGEATKTAINNYPIGGLIYMGQNLETPAQTKEMLANTQAFSMERIGLPMFLCVDEEGGEVARLGNNANFTDAPKTDFISEIGESGNPEDARALGDQIGTYLSTYGFNVDFAPVCDVITNPANKVVALRSFGSDPEIVSSMSIAFSEALLQHNVYATYKHFPGHGATADDTHAGYAYTNKTLDELKASELIPFRDAIDHDAKFIMIAHISLPNVIGDGTPASLSSYIMKDLLRDEMGYEGIIITDALNMGAITNTYGQEAAAVMTIKAGADIALLSGSFEPCYQAVLNAVKNGELSQEQIDDSVRRILRLKFEMMDQA